MTIDNKIIRCSRKINSIITPLKNILNVNLFSLNRYYHDNSMFILSNRHDWLNYYLKPKDKSNTTYPNIAEVKVLFLEEYPKDSAIWSNLILPLQKKLGIYQLTVLPFHSFSYTDIIILGTLKQDQAFYRNIISHYDILKHFLLYFNDKARHEIKAAAEHKFFNEHDILMNAKPQTTPLKTDKHLLINTFISKLNIHRFYLPDIPEDIYFTRREMDCIKLIVAGYNYKKIALKLKISAKTIYEYIEKIRDKLKCNSKKELQERLTVVIHQKNNLPHNFVVKKQTILRQNNQDEKNNV